MLSKTENVVAKKTQKTVANDINREYTRSGAKKKKKEGTKKARKSLVMPSECAEMALMLLPEDGMCMYSTHPKKKLHQRRNTW